MNFEYMTSSQIAALVLGIVFSIFAVATTFLAFKYAKKINSFVKAISLALVAPFLAMIAWLFLILSFLDGFRNDEVLNIIISILIALFICCMIILIAKALYNKNKDKFVEDEDDEEEPVDDSLETIGEEETEPVQTATLLLNDAKNDEVENEEDKLVDEEETTDSTTETKDVVEANELSSEEVKNDEEKTEEPTEESDVESDKEEDSTESEETPDENKDEVVEDEVVEDKNTDNEDDSSDDDDDDDDKEFQEFLNDLRKKIDSDDNDSKK